MSITTEPNLGNNLGPFESRMHSYKHLSFRLYNTKVTRNLLLYLLYGKDVSVGFDYTRYGME